MLHDSLWYSNFYFHIDAIFAYTCRTLSNFIVPMFNPFMLEQTTALKNGPCIAN